jgi:hypothetical protein
MNKYTATEMRTRAGEFRRNVKREPVLVRYHDNMRRFDYSMVCINKDDYDKLLEKAVKNERK